MIIRSQEQEVDTKHVDNDGKVEGVIDRIRLTRLEGQMSMVMDTRYDMLDTGSDKVEEGLQF
jgi:hypothetical protein